MSEEKKDDNPKPKELEKVEGGKSVNDLISEVNALEFNWWKDYKTPLDKQRKAGLKKCGFEKTPAANIKHCYLGSVLAMIASVGTTADDIKKCFSFK
jgi:hypothetical protein